MPPMTRRATSRVTSLTSGGVTFLFSDTDRVIATVLEEEGHPPASIFDFVQGITALARDKPHQDARLELEGKASKLLAAAA